jgi:alkanesulfonate monooxygenase SsuD/methylene tetrahydromethanopterin reductase-like flavin-dependent oxidoreductase (luciferase family)
MTLLMLRFDMRRPEIATVPREAMYASALEMCSWADERGFASVALSEHHGVEDGYLPTPLVLATAILSRTKTITVSVSALLAVLYEPVRLAEEIAVLDNVAPGRLVTIAGLGYRDVEYAMFGVERKRRGAILDEHIQVLLDAWTGEPFSYRGATVRVTPTPATKPHPLLFVGGTSEVAAKRAARFGLPFFPDKHEPALEALYHEECARNGTSGFVVMPNNPCYVHIAEDPEKAWAQVGPHMLHDAQSYASWQPPGQVSSVLERATTLDELKKSNVYRVLTPDDTVALAKESGALMFHPLVGGLDPAIGWESLQLFEDKVRPRL